LFEFQARLGTTLVEDKRGVLDSSSTLGMHKAASLAAPQAPTDPFQLQAILSATIMEHQVDSIAIGLSSFRMYEFTTDNVLQAFAIPAELKTLFAISSRMKDQLDAVGVGLASQRMNEETALLVAEVEGTGVIFELKGLPLRGAVAVGNHAAAGLHAEVFAVVGLELNPLVTNPVDVERLPLRGAVAVGHNAAVGLCAEVFAVVGP
jgi:hypothetical protein